MLIISILIRIDSPGPVFYKQERVGQNGRTFKLLKFRSMISDAEADGPVWAEENDHRVTRVGQWLRKWRLDEIPQMINVLTGEMSFVGPRPERPYFVEKLRKEIPFYDQRFSVKPGVTGWAQIKYATPKERQDAAFSDLEKQAETLATSHPGQAEPLIWEAIILSTHAGVKGGLGALGLVKQAKGLYESALKLQPDALEGSAYNSLGVLYYKVPGWPVGFGDKAKAQELLQKALAINPKGIDPNFFYGEYLVENGKAADAVAYLERAIGAPARPGRDLADAGRREEAKVLLAKARGEAK